MYSIGFFSPHQAHTRKARTPFLRRLGLAGVGLEGRAAGPFSPARSVQSSKSESWTSACELF